ncbi:RNA ligase partner protein [Candidatus Micrarchaeota archaeon]|nr:RNA ligase partner protein [Candidatus Micrarchaeota archaeon]
MKNVKKYVLDTSLFVNPAARAPFGNSPQEAVEHFAAIASEHSASFYMPPSIWKELSNFAPNLHPLEGIVKRKAPNIYSINLPAAIFYEFIDDVRGRVNKGLRLAEEFAVDNRPDNDEKLRKLRDKYRDSMRTGIVDSKEDFEIVLLAYELEAAIVTGDEGIHHLANKVGCEWIDASKFYAILHKKKKKA